MSYGFEITAEWVACENSGECIHVYMMQCVGCVIDHTESVIMNGSCFNNGEPGGCYVVCE